MADENFHGQKMEQQDNSVSVITICRNSEAIIEETMISVLQQQYGNFEYIIVDGASTDQTVKLIQNMIPAFTDKGIRVDFRSEKDKGIQDAENKGLARATNHWSILLHAGDTFANDRVLNNIFAEKEDFEACGIYGDTIYVYNGIERTKKARPFETIFADFTLPFCTQSVFVKTDVYKKYGFDPEYSPAADYHLFAKLYADGCKFRYLNLPVARYKCGGISNLQQAKGIKSKLRTQEEIGKMKYTSFYKWRLIKQTELRAKLKKCLPDSIVAKIRKRNITKLK